MRGERTGSADIPVAPGAVSECGLSTLEALFLGLETAARTVSAEEPGGVLRGMLEGLRRLLRADEAVLAILDESRRGFLVRRSPTARWSDTGDEWASLDEENPIGWVGLRKRPLWRNHLASDLQFPAADRVEEGSEILAPLGGEGECWGVLGCRSRMSYAYRQEDVELFKKFAAVASACLDRSRQFQEIRNKALLDGLTDLLNRGSFKQILEWEVERCRRYQHRLALLLMDVDDFKEINDTHGHVSGDAVLVGIARILKRRLRRFDIIARYGGEEFVALLPETSLLGGKQAAEKICRSIEGAHGKGDPPGFPGRVTVSIGVSEFPGAARSSLDLLQSADRALYEAKGAGKNRTVVSMPAP